MSDENNQAEQDDIVEGAAKKSSAGKTAEPSSEPEVVELAAEVEADLVVLQEELDSAKELSLRTQAEMQNLRRRVERDVENAHKYGSEKLIGELLLVVDNLERTIAAIDSGDESKNAVMDGVELTLKSLQDVLARAKVETVDPQGEVFNPELHQAMSMVPNEDVAPNTVIEVFQKGYTLHGRLIRPAMVLVSKSP